MSLKRRDRGAEAEAGEVKLGLVSQGRVWLYPLNPIQEGGYLGSSHYPVTQGWFS